MQKTAPQQRTIQSKMSWVWRSRSPIPMLYSEKSLCLIALKFWKQVSLNHTLSRYQRQRSFWRHFTELESGKWGSQYTFLKNHDEHGCPVGMVATHIGLPRTSTPGIIPDNRFQVARSQTDFTKSTAIPLWPSSLWIYRFQENWVSICFKILQLFFLKKKSLSCQA